MSGGAGAGAFGGAAGSGGTATGGFGGDVPSICGNGFWEWDEQCDDGNVTAGDGCTASCQLEPEFTCNIPGVPCEPVVCGDDRIDFYRDELGNFRNEECDDGNLLGGDGCDAVCTIEPGWACPDFSELPCRPIVCGDGFQDFRPDAGGESGAGGVSGGSAGTGGSAGGVSGSYEPCDDGNTTSGDGCDASCEIEPGWRCDVPGTPCRQPACGDGIQEWIDGPPGSGGEGGGSAGFAGTGGGSSGFYEQCDDGNEASGDGCSASCEVEPGWLCEMPAEPCREPRCGDGLQDWIEGSGGSAGSGGAGTGGGSSGAYEQCDDGNEASGDGCDASCEIEPGYVCTAPATPCRIPTCGDGFQDYVGSGGAGGEGGLGGSAGSGGGWPPVGYEPCDDGNTTPGDGCNASCEIEPGWACSSWPDSCHLVQCGDGVIDFPEECDDGNIFDDDGCPNDCSFSD